MKHLIKLTVNGEEYEVAIEPNRSLLDVLRDDLELTGTKKGCETGDCGACTVVLDGKTVNACLILAVSANGKSILTIEGVAQGGKLHPVQEAFIEHGAIQCGYCTPGMILSAKSLLEENPRPTEWEVREAIAGNLCRCTGYVKIVKAILAVAEEMAKAPVA
ncbi:MAG: (2Fe-2S)-binding protein [Dehalococcoidia bacterium]|nr:(2Fe-2S)-binding protein [Dehalococcoidia bacterium]